jgi:cytosine/adenosine deaminase-related metal-dependent hydrolase
VTGRVTGPAPPGAADVLLRAAWVCPIDGPPLRDGWVAIRDDRISAVGHGHDAPPARDIQNLGATVLLPALVNTHTHLELSWLRARVPPATDFLSWVGRLMAQRPRVERRDDPEIMGPLEDAIRELRAGGTIAVGDISNSLASGAPLAAARMPAVIFHEIFGFRVTDGRTAVQRAVAAETGLARGDVRIRVAPHAPFSVSRELFVAIAEATRDLAAPRTSVHLAESPEEVRLLREGAGPWQRRLLELGAWRIGWRAPACGPGDYVCDLGLIGPGTLVVHGVQLTDAELGRLAAAGATLVTCPRSNRWVGVGDPPIARFLASGVALALGTDSLASAADLNLFAELAALRQLAPDAPSRRLLGMATDGGARALGLADALGTIAPGKRAALIAVDVPPGTADPEEALLSGVTPERVHWAAHGGYHEDRPGQ